MNDCLLELHTVVFKRLKTLVPKHQIPVICNIEVLQADVLRRSRCRGAFQAKSGDQMIFTSQSKAAPPFQRKIMKVLKGDTFFRNLQVTSMSISKMIRCTMEVHGEVFADSQPPNFIDTDDAPHEPMLNDETQLEDNEVIPFPIEHDVSLAIEQQYIMDTQLLVDIGGVGSGERAKAYLMQRLHMVLVCMTSAHKKLVWANLQRFVKEAGLVSLACSPPKPPALIAYEKAKVGAPRELPLPPALPSLPSVTVPKQPSPIQNQVVPVSSPSVVLPSAPSLASFGSKLL